MRLEVSRRTDLALQVLRAVHGAVAPLAGRVLAARLNTSPTYLASAVAPLVARGWLVSRPGPNGGYQGAATLTAVSVLDVLEAVEGPIDGTACVLVGGPCGVDQCAMHEAWEHGRSALEAALAATPAVE